MRSRRTGHTGLATLLLAAGLTVGGWLPAPAANAVPGTIARTVAVDLARLQTAGLRATGPSSLRASVAGETPAAVVCAPIRFTAVALSWNQAEGVSPSAVIQAGDSATSFRRPMELDDGEGPDPGTADYHAAIRGTDPVWVHDARCIRLRLRVPAGVTVSDLRAVFVNTSGTAGVPTRWHATPGISAAARSGFAFGPSAANAQANAPYWITRAQWGADESLRNCGPNYADTLKAAFVHHTATENTYTRDEADDIVRSILYFHTQVRGWCDIAYNFLVDRFGRVYIGRFGGPGKNVIPASQQGFNTSTTSIAAIGTYTETQPPAAVLFAIKKTLAWRLDVAHLPPKGWAWLVSAGGPNTRYAEGTGVTLRLITAHRITGYTDCPGDDLFAQLASIREGTSGMGLPKMWRVKQSTDAITPGTDAVQYTASGSETLLWTVTVVSEADGTPAATLNATGIALNVQWDGKQGLLAATAGTYDVTVTGKSLTGGVARSATFVLTVNEAPLI